MRLRASLAISFRFILLTGIATGALTGCHHAAGKIMADTTLLPYKAPDIDDLTGIDSDAEPSDPASVAGSAAAAATGGK